MFYNHILKLFFLWSISYLANAGNILLFPYGHGYTSRLADMAKMALILQDKGHNVTFLINQVDQIFLKSVPNATFFTYPPHPGRITLIDSEDRKSIYINAENTTSGLFESVTATFQNHLDLCEELLKTFEVLKEVKAKMYDVLIVDMVDNCGRILTEFLEIPTMTYTSAGFLPDTVLFPNLPSFIPMPVTSLTSKMTFLERVKNTAIMFLFDKVLFPNFYRNFEILRDKYGIKNNSKIPLERIYADQICLVNADFTLESPRPLLPNVVLIGGMFVPEVKPLDPKIKTFMDRSGKYGVVLVSFGSLVKEFEPGKTEIIADVLKSLKTNVIWRFDKNKIPKNIGSNTMVLDWIPQTDILAHPNTKAFVTHCGIHGTYETLYHGIPVVAIPLMFDQYDNAHKLTKYSKMGVYVDFKTLTRQSFGHAINEVLNNPTYKENAMYSSQVLKDHPITPKEKFNFYVDYLIRHKGIGRMKLEPMSYLNPYQLFCVDAVAFLLSIVLVIIIAFFYIIRCCLKSVIHKFRMKNRIKEKET